MNKKLRQEQKDEHERDVETADLLLSVKYALNNRIGAGIEILSSNSLLLSFESGERFELKIERKA
ncbi:MAG: hypothetical protein K2G44_02505 [Clostridia bacterium]|nr:hypothetical protein [Clostridia bacterium]